MCRYWSCRNFGAACFRTSTSIGGPVTTHQTEGATTIIQGVPWLVAHRPPKAGEKLAFMTQEQVQEAGEIRGLGNEILFFGGFHVDKRVNSVFSVDTFALLSGQIVAVWPDCRSLKCESSSTKCDLFSIARACTVVVPWTLGGVGGSISKPRTSIG